MESYAFQAAVRCRAANVLATQVLLPLTRIRTSADWNGAMAIFPGAAISLAVFGFNLFGDALRDV